MWPAGLPAQRDPRSRAACQPTLVAVLWGQLVVSLAMEDQAGGLVVVAGPLPLMITSGERPSWFSRRRGREIDRSPLLAAVPSIAHALATGDVVRVVGPQGLLDGIASGALSYLQGPEGHYGTVVDRSHRIVGHVQLQHSDALAHSAGALAAFQLASAMTLQYYLHRIDQRLEEIADLVRRQRSDSAWAVVGRGAAEVDRLLRLVQRGPLSQTARVQLDREERAVDLVARTERRPVIDLIAEIDQLRMHLPPATPSGWTKEAVEQARRSIGGLRGRARSVAKSMAAISDHWSLVCAAAHVHAALAAIQIIDDEMWDQRSRDVARADALIARRDEIREHADRIAALPAILARIEDLVVDDITLRKPFARAAAVATATKDLADQAIASLDAAGSPTLSNIVIMPSSRGRPPVGRLAPVTSPRNARASH